MLKDYLIVERSALPDYFLRVVEARKLLESGACAQVGEAVTILKDATQTVTMS